MYNQKIIEPCESELKNLSKGIQIIRYDVIIDKIKKWMKNTA